MKSPAITWISADDPPETFPEIDGAFDVPDGLLAAGGDLSAERLLYAYRHGIFPWYDEGQPILWWSPDPRCVLRPHEFHVARRLRRSIRRNDVTITFNQSFPEVIAACAEDREGQQGTWITPEMTAAYTRLHDLGWAHSVEVRTSGRLIGGLYGLAIGRAFFGESMFSRRNDGSKIAMLALCQQLVRHDFDIIDCQVESPHLVSLGASMMPRRRFAALLRRVCKSQSRFAGWPGTVVAASELLAY